MRLEHRAGKSLCVVYRWFFECDGVFVSSNATMCFGSDLHKHLDDMLFYPRNA